MKYYKIHAIDEKLADALMTSFQAGIANPGGEVKITVRTLDDLLVGLNTLKRTIDTLKANPLAGEVEAHATVELLNGACISLRLQR